MSVTTIIGGGGGGIQSSDALTVLNNTDLYGRYGPSVVVANGNELEITSTSATQLFTYTPPSTGMYAAYITVRVITAATTVTLTLTWYDATGSQQTSTLIDAVSEPVGETTSSLAFSGTNSGAIVASITAGTANQVYVTWSVQAFS